MAFINFTKIKAVLFDMDGVIADSMPAHARAWIDVLKKYGADIAVLDIYLREGMTGPDSVRDIFIEKNIPVPDDGEIGKLQLKKHEIFESGIIGVFPAVEEILLFLKSKKMLLGLVTGSLKRSIFHVLPDTIGALFDTIVTAESVSRGKPDAEPYRRALENLGIRRECAVAVENAPMGVASAKNAGIACVALGTTLTRDHLSAADIFFPNHPALAGFFRENIG